MTAAITQTTKKKQQQLDVNATIESIWKRYLSSDLAPQILNRGISYFGNTKQQDVLITGMNPIYYPEREHTNNVYSFGGILHTHTVDNYWKFLRTMLVSPLGHTDLRDCTTYLDLFYFRENSYDDFDKAFQQNAKGKNFLQEQLNLTRHILENIVQPKVILVMSTEAASFWPRPSKKGPINMGYDMKLIEGLPCGYVFQITGLLNEGPFENKKAKTNLKGTYVLFSSPITRLTRGDRKPTARQIAMLLEKYEKNVG